MSAGYNINPAQSSTFAPTASAESGAPFYNSAGITFGNADIGAASLTNEPNVTTNPSAVADAAASGGSGSAAPVALGGAGLPGTSGLSTSTILIGGLLLAGAIAAVIILNKNKAK